MQFYSGPLMHLLSGVDIEGTTAKGALSLFRQPRNVMRYIGFLCSLYLNFSWTFVQISDSEHEYRGSFHRL
jgi:hypothetical protein